MYDVRYKQRGQWFWRRVKDVREDGLRMPFRFLLTTDRRLIEIPAEGTSFEFSPQRAEEIETREMEKLAGKGEKE